MLDKTILIKIIETKIPFGKYKGYEIYKIPVSYLEWMRNNNGFPKNQLGMLLETMYVIRINGLEFLLKPLIEERKNSID
ncbi:MAG: DUF3820 family protein [Chitinophagales bacterium]|nr:DUF3820 family protein [Chitinophagales bacterium]MCZ2393988.1 DUF3820 family protein [Chitinophagales bacterium]